MRHGELEQTSIRAAKKVQTVHKPHEIRRSSGLNSSSIKLGFLAPATVTFTAVMLVPIATNFFYAFTNWDGYRNTFDIVGFANFSRMLADQQTQQAFLNTMVFTAVNAPLQIAIGLLLAVTLQGKGRMTSTLRVVVVFPFAISGVVLGFLGNIIFDPSTGILPSISKITPLAFLGQNWLGDPQLAMASVIAMNLWQWSGFTMLIFLAGLSTIPAELYEAARLDGASNWAQFRHISWPLLAPAATINIVLTIIGGLKVFDIIYVLTKGGPGNSTESVVMRVTAQGSFANFGYSSAISLVLTIAILVIAGVLIAILRRREMVA